MNNVIPLITDNMNAQQALDVVKKKDPTDVLIIQYINGAISINSSKMNNAEALYMLECAKLRLLKEVTGIIHAE